MQQTKLEVNKEEIQRLDPALAQDDPGFHTAVVLLSAVWRWVRTSIVWWLSPAFQRASWQTFLAECTMLEFGQMVRLAPIIGSMATSGPWASGRTASLRKDSCSLGKE